MKIIIPQVNFEGVNTNLVAVCSRCISFLCVQDKLRFTFMLDPIRRLLTLSDVRELTQQPFLKKKKRKKKKKKTIKQRNKRLARPIYRKEPRVLFLILRICAYSVQ